VKRIILAVVATSAIAAGLISGSATAAVGCSDAAYVDQSMAANVHLKRGMSDNDIKMYESASAEYSVGWSKVKSAPLPCLPLLRQARTHELRAYNDYLIANISEQKGDLPTELRFLNAGNHELDVASSLYVKANA
jgi:hypothetical protein